MWSPKAGTFEARMGENAFELRIEHARISLANAAVRFSEPATREASSEGQRFCEYLGLVCATVSSLHFFGMLCKTAGLTIR